MLRLNHNLWVWVKHYLGLNMTTKKPHSKRSRYQLVINWMGSSWLLGSSFLPRKRVHSVKWSTLFKMQHADANFGPAYTICSWKWTSWSKVVGNGFGSQLCPYRTNQPMNLPLLQSKWSVTQKKKKNFKWSHFHEESSNFAFNVNVGSKSNDQKFKLLPQEDVFPIPPWK